MISCVLLCCQNGYLRRFRDAYHCPLNCESRNKALSDSHQVLFDSGGAVHYFRKKNEVNVRRCSLLLESRPIELVSRQFLSLLDISFDDMRL